eukprot:UN1864
MWRASLWVLPRSCAGSLRRWRGISSPADSARAGEQPADPAADLHLRPQGLPPAQVRRPHDHVLGLEHGDAGAEAQGCLQASVLFEQGARRRGRRGRPVGEAPAPSEVHEDPPAPHAAPAAIPGLRGCEVCGSLYLRRLALEPDRMRRRSCP